jgi:hypothetical protein
VAATFELGLDTFGDVTVDAEDALRPQASVLRDVVEEAVLADSLGIDAFGVGEHHRPDFAISAPEVVLAAIAARARRITLGSAVTVLSTDDPVRVFQRFSTLNGQSSRGDPRPCCSLPRAADARDHRRLSGSLPSLRRSRDST